MFEVDVVVLLTYTELDRAEDGVDSVEGGATIEADDVRRGTSRQQVLKILFVTRYVEK